MCPDGTQCRLGSPDAPDATRYGAWVQDAQDAQDAESRLGESGCNTTVSDAGHLFADVSSLLDASWKSLLREHWFGYMLSLMMAYTSGIILPAIPARVI